MIKRLIFDVDGTLITGVNFSDAVEATLKKIDLYSEENMKGFLEGIKTYEKCFDNYNISDYIKHFECAINNKLPKDFLDVFFEELKSTIPNKNENLIYTISELSKKYELVLLTNYFGKSQLNRLNNMGIGHFFIECFGEELIKPNLEAYISACGKNKPSECVMIGDDISLDIEYAKKAGLNTIFVNTKNIKVENVKTLIVKSVEQIDNNLIDKL